MGASFRVDISELEALQVMLAKVAVLDLDALENAFGEIAVTNAQDRFEKKADPDRTQWKKWSEKYHKKIAGDARRSVLMGPTARLQQSLTYENRSDGVYVGSTMVYARVHQQGWEERNIPARPYLGVGTEDAEDFYKATETVLKQGGIA
jgi:phage virion morphogenesis protein